MKLIWVKVVIDDRLIFVKEFIFGELRFRLIEKNYGWWNIYVDEIEIFKKFYE